MIKCARD